MKIIETKNLHKKYNPDSAISVHALQGVDVQIEQGEFTAIVGPSGSGKSTLLNIIGGLDNPSEGKITIGGEDISTLSDGKLIDFRRNNIGFVFQSYNLIPVLTAKENIEFVMLLQGRSKAEMDARTSELLAAVGIADNFFDKLISYLFVFQSAVQEGLCEATNRKNWRF